MYRNVLDGKSALAWELPFPGHLSSTKRWGFPLSALPKDTTSDLAEQTCIGPSTSSREALLACPPFPPWNLPPFTVESTLSTLCSRSDPPLFRQGVALTHLGSLPPHDLVLWTDGSVPFPFGKGGSGVLANCSLCGTEATLSFSAGPVSSSYSAEACAILHALCWSRQYHKSCHFSSLLLISDSRFVLPSTFPLIFNSVADLAGTVFSRFLFYWTTMDPRTLISPGERHG